MGFQDRDYTRDSSYTGAAGGWGLDYISPVVKGLIAANIVVFLLQIFAVRPVTEADLQARWDQLPSRTKAMYREMDRQFDELRNDEDGKPKEGKKSRKTREKAKPVEQDHGPPPESYFDGMEEQRVCIVHEWLDLKPSLVMRGQIWRLLSYSFCHDRMGVFHILFNMLFLYRFGMTLESMYGGREFLLFYLVAAVFSGITTIALDLYLGSDIPAVGASGSIMAVMMLFAIHYPRALIRVFFLSIEARWLVCLYLLFDLYPVLLALAGDQLLGDVAHAGHLGGLAFGFLYWRTGFRLEKFWDRIAKGRRAASRQARRLWGTYPKIARPSPEQDQDIVDEILKKLHESGVDSLTTEERRILEEASQRLRQRRR
jgi:membrane associated rhomboid family serine protease